MKIIGAKKNRSPEENLRKIEELTREADLLRPYRKPRGMVLKFKTWDDVYQFCITRAARKL